MNIRTTSVFLFLILAINCFSQGFIITNGDKHKTIKQTDVVEVFIQEDEAINKCCTYREIHGTIISVSKDSLTIKSNLTLASLDFKRGEIKPNSWDNWNMVTSIPKADILHLTRYKSERSRKTRNDLSMAGGLIMMAGLGTTANALIFSKKGNRRGLLIAGGVQVIAGITLGVSTYSVRHEFKDTNHPWRFEQ